MSIASEITRLQNAKSKLKTNLTNKGVAVGNEKLDAMVDLVNNIQGGSGTDTSDATATSSDILLGKTAYVAEGKIEGTIETYDYSVDDGGSGEDTLGAFLDGTLTSYSNENITKIRQYAFYYSEIMELDLPNVTEIESNIISNSKVSKINIPNVTKIGYGALGYSKLVNVELPLYEGTIQSTFDNSRDLQSVKLPKANKMSGNAFYYCQKLSDVYLGYEGLVSIDSKYCFSNAGTKTTNGFVKIHVRLEYADQYAIATNWSALIADGTIVIVGDYKEE